MNRNTAWLGLILLLSIALRCIGLESRGIWYDDAFSILLSARPLPDLIAGTAADTMPPLYTLILHFWQQINAQVWFLRLVGLGFSVASISLLYQITARLFDPRAGRWAALLAAISPFQIYHAQELRPYTLLALAELGYAWFFVRIWQSADRPARADWIGLVLCGAAAMYTHNLVAFAIIVPDLFLFFRREWRLLRRLITAQLGILALALPWLIYLPGQMAHISGGWSIQRPGLTEVMQSLIITTSNLPLPPGIWLALALLISLWALVLIIFELVRPHHRPEQVYLLSAFALVPPVIMAAVSYITTPVFVTRGFIVSHLAYAALAGYVISRTWPRMGIFFLSMFVIGAAIVLPYQYTYQEFPRSPFRQTAAYLVDTAQSGDRVINDNKLSSFPMRIYQPGLEQSFIKDEAGGHNDTLSAASARALQITPAPDLPAAVGDSRRVYFVVFTRAIQEYRAAGQSEHPALAWLNQRYRQVDRQVFGDQEVYCFER